MRLPGFAFPNLLTVFSSATKQSPSVSAAVMASAMYVDPFEILQFSGTQPFPQ